MDIADVGFRVDTSELEKGTQGLNKMAAAAGGVQNTTVKMAAAMESSANTAAKAVTSAARAEVARAQSLLKTLQATQGASSEDKKAANELIRKTKAVLADATAEEKRTRAINDAAIAQRKANAVTAQSSAKPSLVVNNGRSVKPGQPANDQMPNRFNTGNIAAQFQDIGVTASMGMNPLLIAMQQGTQLSAIFNSMEKPLAGLAIALKSVFNVISLGTIAIVALVVAGIQMIDWTQAAKSGLIAVANGIDMLSGYISTVTPYILGLGAALTLWYSPAIIAGISTLIFNILAVGASALSTGIQMAAGWVIGMGPIAWVIAGILAVSAAFAAFGGDAVSYMKIAANGLVGTMVGAYNTVLATWKILPAAMGSIIIQTTNVVLAGINNMVNGFLDLINGMINSLPESIRPKGDFIKFKMSAEFPDPFADQMKQYEKVAGEEFAKALKKDYVGAASSAVTALATKASAGLKAFAATLGLDKDTKKKGGGKTDEEKYEDIIRGADRRIAALEAERASIGLTEFATAKLKFETELLNEAQQKNIILTNAGKLEIAAKAEQMALLTDEIRVTKDNLQFAQETTQGFFSDMRSGLEQGKSAWESFGNAVRNVLNKIVDSMINANIDKMFGGSGNSGGLSLLGGLAGSIGGLFGGQGAISRIATFGSASGVGPIPMAKGGAFTNGIYNKTTPFAFANGGSFGVMGEAGPEAVMPLHRGPDGSLGVKMSGGAGNDNTEAGNTYYIDARGADQGAVARVEQALLLYAGPGVVERRVMNAQTRGAL